MSTDSRSVLESPGMAKLLTLVEEATRSTEEGVKFFVEPIGDSLRRSISRRHHMVFGRRGSGKSSLLRKAAADLTVDRRPIAWVDLEPFKGHAYPDLLLSVLIAAFKSFKKWLETAAVTPANRRSFWKTFFGGTPTKPIINQKACQDLAAKFNKQINELEGQLHAADAAEIQIKEGLSESSEEGSEASGKVDLKNISAGGGIRTKQATANNAEVSEKYQRSKVEFLRRHIMDYQRLFDEMAEVSKSDAYLFLDDLYHIRKSDQSQVVDYFHSIAKGHALWLKVGTIRHRTTWYVHGNPPVGLKLGDDADEIDLDLTLEKYALAKRFLLRVLTNLTQAVELRIDDFLTDGAIDRLVLASGGVARDFLSIFRRSVDVARERNAIKINAEDINVAAGEYDSSKREEFKRDTYSEEEQSLDKIFRELRDFCIETAETNCFLIDKDSKGMWVEIIHELVDLKLLHLVRSRVTVNTRQGKIYEAYMLDLSQYTGARKRRGLEIVEFWKGESKDKLRKASLIYREERAAS